MLYQALQHSGLSLGVMCSGAGSSLGSAAAPAGRNESACKTRAPEAAGAAVARGQLLRKDALLDKWAPREIQHRPALPERGTGERLWCCSHEAAW